MKSERYHPHTTNSLHLLAASQPHTACTHMSDLARFFLENSLLLCCARWSRILFLKKPSEFFVYSLPFSPPIFLCDHYSLSLQSCWRKSHDYSSSSSAAMSAKYREQRLNISSREKWEIKNLHFASCLANDDRMFVRFWVVNCVFTLRIHSMTPTQRDCCTFALSSANARSSLACDLHRMLTHIWNFNFDGSHSLSFY